MAPASLGERRGGSTPALEQRVFLNLVRAEEHVMYELNTLLRGHGLTEPQYNVLRILRGAGKEGLPCRSLAERMLTRVPDITRLVDRLVASGHAVRRRGESRDRRMVLITVTPRGLRLLADLDRPVLDLHRNQFNRFRRGELRELDRLLKLVLGS